MLKTMQEKVNGNFFYRINLYNIFYVIKKCELFCQTKLKGSEHY